jgi:hypothetical protein
VRRQVRRPFALVASREETKIRERFPIYMALRAAKVTTQQPGENVAEEIVDALPAELVQLSDR